MADINYGELADAIVDAIQRSRATGVADDPMSLLSQSLSDSVDSWSKKNTEGQDKEIAGRAEFKKLVAVSTNQLLKLMGRLSSEVLVLQRQGLAFNKDFRQTMASNGERIRGLPGGLKTSLESLFAFQRNGMMNVGKGTLALSNRMKITGQNIQGLVKAEKALLQQGLVGGTQRDNLINSLNTTAQSYGVAADHLVASINQLTQSMPLLGLTGGAGAMADKLAEFTAQRPEHAEQATQLVNSLVAAVQSGDMGQIFRLGLSDQVDQILAGTADINTLIQKAAQGSIAAGGGIGTMGKEVISSQLSVVGATGMLAETLQKSMALTNKQTKGKTVDRLQADFMVALNESLAPLQEELGNIITGVAEFAGKVVKFVSAVGGIKPILIGLTAIIAKSLISQLKFVVTALRFAGSKAAASSMGQTISNALLASQRAGKSKAGISMLGRAGIWGAAAAAVVIGVPLLTNAMIDSNKINKKTHDLMAKTWEAAKFDRKELGRSRFEEVSKMLIAQNLISAGSARAAFTEGQSASTEQLVAGNTKIVSVLERGLPGKTSIDKRGSRLTPGAIT
tara:strand:+ start:6334 stop:8028 length:1695 start_codon:yes stop_codon:yes gene_type:complete